MAGARTRPCECLVAQFDQFIMCSSSRRYCSGIGGTGESPGKGEGSAGSGLMGGGRSRAFPATTNPCSQGIPFWGQTAFRPEHTHQQHCLHHIMAPKQLPKLSSSLQSCLDCNQYRRGEGHRNSRRTRGSQETEGGRRRGSRRRARQSGSCAPSDPGVARLKLPRLAPLLQGHRVT